MQPLKTIAARLSDACEYLAVLGIMAMVLINCADVIGSKLFSTPVPGATELISLIQLATLSLALGATQKVKGHINVEMFVLMLSKHKRAILLAATGILEFIIFVFLLKEAFNYGSSLKAAGEVSGTIKVAFYPFAYLMGICLCPVVVLVFCDFLSSLKEGFKREL